MEPIATQVKPSGLFTLPRRCGHCGFDVGGADRATSVARIAAAYELFEDVLADIERSAGPGAVHEAAPDGWSPIDHVVHVTQGLDATRRQLFQMRVSGGGTRSISVDLLLNGDGRMSRQAAVRQLDDAALWLLRALATLSPGRRQCDDVTGLVARAAHEVTHHHRLVGAFLWIPVPQSPVSHKE